MSSTKAIQHEMKVGDATLGLRRMWELVDLKPKLLQYK